jgi:outer membrane immunogenic protein
MKSYLLSAVSVATLSLASHAGAADLPSKAAYKAAPAVPFSWTGFYVGGHVGMSAADVSAGPHVIEDGLASAVVDGNLTQVLAGIHGGYNYQMNNNVVLGVEADFNGKFGEGNFQPHAKFSTLSSWDASIRARLGYLVTPHSLVYATGGVAFGHFKTVDATDENEWTTNFLGRTRVGWTVGAGLQYALDSNWSSRIEYRYTDWGTKTIFWNDDFEADENGRTSAPGNADSKLTDHRVIVGLSYKIGGPSGPLASAAMGAIYKAPPALIAPYRWTGFYVGGHVGASAGQVKVSADDGGTGRGGFTQVLAGGHAGYDYQLNNIVFGVEVDVSGKFGGGWFSPGNSRLLSSYDGSVRGRLGHLVTPRSLVYATGGFAWGRFTSPLHEFDPGDIMEILGGDRTGWTVGGGLQYALDSNWSTRIEYRYTDWGSESVNFEAADAQPRPATSKLTESRVITGLSYKFGAPGRLAPGDSIAANWAGVYAGGQVGGSGTKLTYGNGPIAASEGDEYAEFTQALAGGHLGYNHQFNRFVVGVEGDINAKFGHGFKFDDLLRPTSSWDGSIRARFGVTATRALVYVTGGFAFGQFSTPQSGAHEPQDPPEEHIGKNRTGWTVGGGIQYALDNNWSARIEYRHTDWGTKTLTNITDTGCGDGCPETVGAKLIDDRVAVGVSYRFGRPVTRY